MMDRILNEMDRDDHRFDIRKTSLKPLYDEAQGERKRLFGRLINQGCVTIGDAVAYIHWGLRSRKLLTKLITLYENGATMPQVIVDAARERLEQLEDGKK